MVIEEIMYQHSLNFPDKIAIISGELRVSYGELWRKISQAADWFSSKGWDKNSRIVISASKNIDFIYTYFGAHLAGMICVPIDPETNAIRLKRIIECASPSAIIGELRNKDVYDIISFSEVKGTAESTFDFPKGTDRADLLFTTGTTGLPKGLCCLSPISWPL